MRTSVERVTPDKITEIAVYSSFVLVLTDFPLGDLVLLNVVDSDASQALLTTVRVSGHSFVGFRGSCYHHRAQIHPAKNPYNYGEVSSS